MRKKSLLWDKIYYCEIKSNISNIKSQDSELKGNYDINSHNMT